MAALAPGHDRDAVAGGRDLGAPDPVPASSAGVALSGAASSAHAPLA